MALVPETGSGSNPLANTYATVDQAKAYAAARGVEGYPTEDAKVEVLLIKAMDYIAAQEGRFKGWRATPSQPLSWPRSGACIFGRELDGTDIPAQLVNGQCQLTIDAFTTELMPTFNPANGMIKRDKVGPIETEFFAPGDAYSSQPTFTAADAIMAELYEGGKFNIRLRRA